MTRDLGRFGGPGSRTLLTTSSRTPGTPPTAAVGLQPAVGARPSLVYIVFMLRRGLTHAGLGMALGVATLGVGSASAEAQDLNVDDWLRRPGVKLVAVEFFATWCKPCMEAVPRWRALHEKYQDRGLRLIVVSTQDADGACTNPGWSPDLVVCDDDGFLAERFGAKKLPAAFLWSWQGQLLGQQVHVDEVEAKIEKYMRRAPRVEVEVGRLTSGAGIDKDDLFTTVRGELRGADKLVVVATAAERERLRRILRRSLTEAADEALQCKIGAEITANSLVRASVTGRRTKRLQLRLLSAERGCLVASATVRWRKNRPTSSAREAVAELLQSLRFSPTQFPWSRRAGRTGRDRRPESVASDGDSGTGTDYEALLREAKEASRRAQAAKDEVERARRKRQERLEKAWAAVSEVAQTQALPKDRRISAIRGFIADFPTDNPHLKTAREYLAALRAGREPVRRDEMVTIAAGKFLMGCNEQIDSDCEENEKPSRRPYVRKFSIDKTEVTVGEFRTCVNGGACSADGLSMPYYDGKDQVDWVSYCNWSQPNREDHPINCVTWDQAVAYCKWVGKRLPTEKEWEKAARGTDGRIFPWGNATYTPSGPRYANIADEALRRKFSNLDIVVGYDDRFAGTAPVGQFPAGASPYGVLDMAGNVLEWTSDRYRGGEFPIILGGSWGEVPKLTRVSFKYWNRTESRITTVGFRCAKSG